MVNFSLKEYILFQNKKKISNLYKSFLIIIEDLKAENHSISDDKYQRIRKRVLDAGNDAIRQFEEEIDNIKID